MSADIQIVYVTDNLSDINPGEDLWRYTYTVSGRTFLESEGFRVFFPTLLYQAFEPPVYPNEEWDAIVITANEFLPEQLFVAQARTGVTGQWEFSVDFLWLGRASDTPNSQRYELFDPDFVTIDPPGALATVAQAIPEPQTSALVLTGLAMLAALSMRSRVAQGCA